MSDHAKCGPSSLTRRMACPGSLVAEDGLPDSSSKYAEEGTLAHALLESILTNQKPPEEYSEDEYPDMMDAVMVAVKWVQAYLDNGYTLHVEVRVNPGDILQRSDCWGTADIVLVKGTSIVVCDYKHGAGVAVEVEGNNQLLAYAAGAATEFFPFTEPENYTLAIIQPRIHDRMPIQEWELPLREINGHWAIMRSLLVLIKPNAPRVTGDHCKWCKAKSECPKRLEDFNEQSASVFAEIDMQKNTTLSGTEKIGISNARIAEILDMAPLLLGYIEDLRTLAVEKIKLGESIPNHKLIRGRSRRKWVLANPELMKKFKAMKLTLDECAPRKILGPAGIEKCKKLTDKQHVNLAKLWEKQPGGLKLVVASAKGDPVVFDSGRAFSDMSDDEAINTLADEPVGFL